MVRGRNLIILTVVDVVLAVVATLSHGSGHQHGFRNVVSSVSFVLFLIGFALLIVMAIAVLVKMLRRRTRLA